MRCHDESIQLQIETKEPYTAGKKTEVLRAQTREETESYSRVCVCLLTLSLLAREASPRLTKVVFPGESMDSWEMEFLTSGHLESSCD